MNIKKSMNLHRGCAAVKWVRAVGSDKPGLGKSCVISLTHLYVLF